MLEWFELKMVSGLTYKVPYCFGTASLETRIHVFLYFSLLQRVKLLIQLRERRHLQTVMKNRRKAQQNKVRQFYWFNQVFIVMHFVTGVKLAEKRRHVHLKNSGSSSSDEELKDLYKKSKVYCQPGQCYSLPALSTKKRVKILQAGKAASINRPYIDFYKMQNSRRISMVSHQFSNPSTFTLLITGKATNSQNQTNCSPFFCKLCCTIIRWIVNYVSRSVDFVLSALAFVLISFVL